MEEQEPIDGLPESLILACLARLHHKDINAASRVCRKWLHLIGNRHFFSLRKQLGYTNHLACLLQPSPPSSTMVCNISNVITRPSDGNFVINLFDPVNREWDRLPQIPNSTTRLNELTHMVSCEGKLVTMDVSDTESLKPVTSVFVWDFATHRCRKGKDMPSSRLGYDTVAADCRVFVVGGQDRVPDGHLFDTVWAYDVWKDEWTELPPMSQKREAGKVMIIGDELWVISGCRTKSMDMVEHSADVYHLQTGEWRRVEWDLGDDNSCPFCVGSRNLWGNIFIESELQLGAQRFVMNSHCLWDSYLLLEQDGNFVRLKVPCHISKCVHSNCSLEI